MNESTVTDIDPAADHALRVYVERVVRPIGAEESEKLRMRKELYGHALAAYDEALATGRPAADSASRAVERMGDAAALRAELQDAVPWWSRWAGWIDRITRRRPQTPRWRHAAWITSIGMAEMATLFGLLMVLAAFGVLPQKANNAEVIGRVTALLVLLMGFNVFQGALVGGRVHDALTGAGSTSARFARAIGIASVGGVAMFVSGALLWLLVGWPDVAPTMGVFASWATLSGIFVVAEVVVSWVDIRQRREVLAWLALDLDWRGAAADLFFEPPIRV